MNIDRGKPNSSTLRLDGVSGFNSVSSVSLLLSLFPDHAADNLSLSDDALTVVLALLSPELPVDQNSPLPSVLLLPPNRSASRSRLCERVTPELLPSSGVTVVGSADAEFVPCIDKITKKWLINEEMKRLSFYIKGCIHTKFDVKFSCSTFFVYFNNCFYHNHRIVK